MSRVKQSLSEAYDHYYAHGGRIVGSAETDVALDIVPPLSGSTQRGSQPEALKSPFASQVSPADEKRVLDMVKGLIYADEPGSSPLEVLPPQTDADAARAIARGNQVADAEEALYLKRPTEDLERWKKFWGLNRRWRRAEAWMGAAEGRRLYAELPELSGVARWMPLWKSFSHDFKRGIDRADPVEVSMNTDDLEKYLAWFGYPKAWHTKNSHGQSLRDLRKGDGLTWDDTERPPVSTFSVGGWAVFTSLIVLVGGLAYVRFRRGP